MSYQSEVLADAPEVFLRLDETSGTVAADASGNGRNGTITGVTLGQASLLTSDTVGKSISVPNTSSWVDIPGAAWMNSSTGVTAEAWVRLDALPPNVGAIFARDQAGNSSMGEERHWVLYVQANGSLRIIGSTSTLNNFDFSSAAGLITTGTVYHIAMVWDMAAGAFTVYRNGVSVWMFNVTGVDTAMASLPIRLGNIGPNNSGLGYYHRGRIDEFAYYKTPLPASRVKAHYDAGIGVAPGVPHGSASGAFTWSGAASGRTIPHATASGRFAWAGSATGYTIPHASALGSFAWAGSATTGAGATRLGAWTADLSRRTNLVLVASGSIDSMPALELPPDGFMERPLIRQSLTVPALRSMADVVGGWAVSALDYAALEDAATVEELGVPHVVIGGHDVTYFRGMQTQIGSFRSEEPFGDLSATVVFPQITSMDEEPDDSNVHPFNWSRIRANVLFVLRRPDGTKTRLWAGHVVSRDIGEGGMTLTCQGSLWQASTDVHKVPTMLDPTDIGTLIAKALNGVASRRYPRLAAPRTGIMSRQRGSWSDSPLAYAQNLLATAWTKSGRQWTVAKVPNTWRTYEMRLKKATPQWTVTNGARGVTADLSRDGVAVRNVIYGHGVGRDGYAWWNYHYPNLRQDDAPAYPYSSAGTVMSVGSTDAGTTSGEGVSVWQARARDLGYNVTVNGVFDSDDAAAARAIQRRYGLQVDGIVGPQTWAGTFDVGGNGGDLTGAIRLPLAADPRTQKWLYNADGSVAGENPEYDPNHLIYADDVDFGSGVTREQGIESAQQIVDRESDPGWTGRITLRADPREGSRFLIAAGDKITLVGFRGADRVLHITGAEYDLQGLTVTLEVDEKSRDAMTLAQIRDRNKEARKDPGRRPGNVNRRSRLDVDSVVPFDGESGAGWIPKHALYGGLWTVIRIPVSELGRVAKLDIRTSGPASKFAIALFGAPIQPEHLVKYVGNPLASDSPFETHAATLEDRFGFIEGWGQKGQAAGYWPGQEGKALTGRLVDTGGFEYASAKPPWVWVAEFSATSTFIQGRILPAPIQ